MLIEIRAKGFALTDGIRLHIERRLGFALDRFTPRVRTVHRLDRRRQRSQTRGGRQVLPSLLHFMHGEWCWRRGRRICMWPSIARRTGSARRSPAS